MRGERHCFMVRKVPLRAHTVLIYAVKKKTIRSSRWQLKVVYAVLIADHTSPTREPALPEDEIRDGRFIRPLRRPICRADGLLTGIMKPRKHLKGTDSLKEAQCRRAICSARKFPRPQWNN